MQYGANNNLLEESEPVESGSDFVTPNQMFSVNLTGLLPATEYSFRVVASNDYRRQYSLQSSFITEESGNCAFTDFCLLFTQCYSQYDTYNVHVFGSQCSFDPKS